MNSQLHMNREEERVAKGNGAFSFGLALHLSVKARQFYWNACFGEGGGV